MKSKITKIVSNLPTYPCLMISKLDDVVVLFIKQSRGVCVCGNSMTAGEYSDDWCMDSFEPFHGTIELTEE